MSMLTRTARQHVERLRAAVAALPPRKQRSRKQRRLARRVQQKWRHAARLEGDGGRGFEWAGWKGHRALVEIQRRQPPGRTRILKAHARFNAIYPGTYPDAGERRRGRPGD